MNTNQVKFSRLVSLLLPGFIVLAIPPLLHSLSLASAVQTNTIAVTTAADTLADDGQCSLREAITAANTDAPSGTTPGECPGGSGDDVIQLAAATYTLAITGTLEDNNEQGDLDILTDTITIQGVSATSTIIQAGTTLTSSVDRVFHVSLPATLILDQVTVQHGKAAVGTVYPGNIGGGIFNEGVLTITHSYIISNSTSAFGGAIYSDLFARLRLENSLIRANLSYIYGGGLYDVGLQTTILTTTFAANLAGEGGAILFKGADKVRIEATTFSGNQATTLGGAIPAPREQPPAADAEPVRAAAR
jgi:CSLREA domain-containing protein